MVIRSFAIVALVLFCSGCAGISVKHLTDSDDKEKIKGVPWNLPMTQFGVEIKYRLKECSPEPKVAIDVVVTPKIELDNDRRYVLKPNWWVATSDISSDLTDSGITTALNTQSTDTTGTAISNTVGTLVQVATGLVSEAKGSIKFMNLVSKMEEKKDVKFACLPSIDQAVKDGPGLKKKVDALTKELADQTAKVALLTEIAKIGKGKTNTDALISEMEEQTKRQQKLAEAQDKLTENLKLTTDVRAISWPHSAKEFKTSKPYRPYASKLLKWFGGKEEDYKNLDTTNFDLSLGIYEPTGSGNWKIPKPSGKEIKPHGGVPVRLAKKGLFVACKSQSCEEELPEGMADDDSHKIVPSAILQIGQIYNIHVAGGIFRSETAAISLDTTTGAPKKLQIAEKVAGAQAITGMTKDVATQLAALPAQLRATELAKTQAETSQLTANSSLATAKATYIVQNDISSLNAQSALLTAQHNLATAQATAETSGVSTQVALLNAQTSLANAQANSKNLDQTSALAAETALLNAQAAQINAATALAKASATAAAK